MMNNLSVLYSVEARVATITLNKPDTLNALDHGLRTGLCIALQQATDDSNVRVIVLASSARGFCSGTDLQESTTISDTFGLLEEQYKPLLTAFMQCPKPIIAAVNGACAGVGASLALACDLMLMSDDAFLFLAFAKIGLVPDGGTCWHLARNIGYKRAFEVITEGGRIGAERCQMLGLVNRVVAGDTLLTEAQAWAQRLAAGAPLMLKHVKQVLHQAMEVDLDETMRLEATAQNICTNSEDGREGVSAFLQKRTPVFTGK